MANIRPQSSNVLGFYGVGGIGKTRLQQHLKTAHLDADKNCLYSSLDFEIRRNRSPHQALRSLVHGFKRQKLKIAFHAFELAYLIYWGKEFPDQEIKKASLDFLEEGGLVSDAVGVANDAGGVVSIGLRVIEYTFKKSKEISFDENLRANLQALSSLTPEEIEKQLPSYFAYDIQQYTVKNPEKKIVIFLDTHEALWADSGRKQSNRLRQDEWLRDGLINAVKGVLFVVERKSSGKKMIIVEKMIWLSIC